jgi:hypothetical protein
VGERAPNVMTCGLIVIARLATVAKALLFVA